MQLKSLTFLLWTAAQLSSAWSVADAETVDVAMGIDQTKVVSSQYKTQGVSGAQLQATYTRPMVGVWSLLAQYRMNFSNTLSAGLIGINYDTEELQTKGGAIAPDGKAEIIRNPVWVVRSFLAFGAFRYVDTLESNNVNLGNKNRVPVQADLYGLSFGVGLHHLFNDSWGCHSTLEYSIASAENFGISSTSLIFGGLFRY